VSAKEQRLLDRLRKATRLDPKSYTDPVIWEDLPAGVYHDGGECEGYFYSLNSLEDHAASADETPLPAWVWACEPVRLAIDARGMIQAELESGDYPEEAYDQIPEPLLDELSAFLDAWCGKIPKLGWEQDYSRIVVLDPVAFEALLAEIHDAPTTDGAS
jgi:hypothetical protein